MALGRFDRGAAAERNTELERRALRLYAAVSTGRVLSALDRGDKAIPRSIIRGGRRQYGTGDGD
jgi:hypothetical protein